MDIQHIICCISYPISEEKIQLLYYLSPWENSQAQPGSTQQMLSAHTAPITQLYQIANFGSLSVRVIIDFAAFN